MPGTRFQLELNARLPEALSRLQELAGDLYYSWDRYSRGLFYQLDESLWHRCGHNPSVFLRRISQRRLDAAARDRAFLEAYRRTLANYDAYMETDPVTPNEYGLDRFDRPIVYLSAELGLHESLPIYSGGLGILAGDLCKAASDMRLPFVAVGLLYRYGNFVQHIDAEGRQHLHNELVRDEDLPVERAYGPDGEPLTFTVPSGCAGMHVRAWWAKAGRARLLLLDTDCEESGPEARCITHNLYPGASAERLQQEIVLGIGGVSALAALGIEPTVWHVNEGHPALSILGRWARLAADGMPADAAIELVAANTVFTTHTPVAAGHEVFPHELIRSQLGPYAEGHGLPPDALLALGSNGTEDVFSLTAFALRCSAHRNGVSRTHGRVASEMESRIWPEIAPPENPVEYVTNGIHVPTFFAREWVREIDDPGWHNEMLNPAYWAQVISAMSNEAFRNVHNSLKLQLVAEIRGRLERRARRLGWSEAQVSRELTFLERGSDVLLIGFARRFAAYKRAGLLLEDPDRLHRLLSDPDRPVVVVYAGRAHQNDEVGQRIIQQIHEITRDPRFHGRVLLLEGYDLALARKLVAGVDVWLNTPEYPLEASGTSGMKAGINGAINLSIADGWWREGFDGENGWSVEPHPGEADPQRRRDLEGSELLDVLEHEVVPAYFERRAAYSLRWIEMMKASMISVLQNFNAQRMLREYVERFYLPSIALEAALGGGDAAPARALAEWRRKVREHWGDVSMRLSDNVPGRADQGSAVGIEVEVRHPGLEARDILVECLVESGEDGAGNALLTLPFEVRDSSGETSVFVLSLGSELAGLLDLRIRAYPRHDHLPHRFDMGLMLWL